MEKKIITYLIKSNINNTETIKSKSIYLSINSNHDKQMYIIHRALKDQQHKHRQGNANTKTRSEVRGGGRKPWKQKGTGRARAGSTRSPLWKGGGVIFGPKNRIYQSKINKKERKLAIKSLIYNKFKQTHIVNILLDKLNKPNTKFILNEFKQSGITLQDSKIKTLLITRESNKMLYLSIRNLPNLELITADNLNVLSLIRANKILITSDALNKISEIYDD
uniref:Large ribosomal subunit protein uL4c n=1 Tax=Membranoptera platyphylla TaxID=1204437 RepID=A0A1I9KQQ4_9FLOR|nr:50S ribosomal protein L4 [Membranoptera platyphylla]AMJ16930.1 50S ribosomal protein L4 [Membranoptera platyphylla]